MTNQFLDFIMCINLGLTVGLLYEAYKIKQQIIKRF